MVKKDTSTYVSGHMHFIPFFLPLEKLEFVDDFQQYMMRNLIII